MKKLAYYSMTATLVLMLIGLGFLSTPADAKQYNPKFPYNPIIFVHGGAGSGAQFESQAMRFTSSGYPQNYIAVLEYDSTFSINTMDQVHARLDQLIADLLKETGANKVDLLGHSLGTRVSQLYLRSSPARALMVAHYVNIDGYGSTDLPGGVPTLALWAGSNPPDFGPPGNIRRIEGATNVTIPGVTHVECATCAASFFEMYKFFTLHEPKTTEILPEPFGSIRLAGRAVLFPQNVGVADSTLEIFKVNSHTGFRIHKNPEAVYAIDETGNWGPFKAKAGEHYEFVLMPQGNTIHHFYYEPFIRSDYLIRLLEARPLDSYADKSEHQSNLNIIRYRELWGDQVVNNDILAINGVNYVNAAICPLSKMVNSTFVYDKGADGVSALTQPIPFYYAITFITGVDLNIAGSNPPDGRIRVVVMPRGGEGGLQVLNVPNWASTTDRITIQIRDFLQWEDIPCGDKIEH
jgi:hypothetical protein